MPCSLDTYILNEHTSPIKKAKFKNPYITLEIKDSKVAIQVPFNGKSFEESVAEVNSIGRKIKAKFKTLIAGFVINRDNGSFIIRYILTPEYVEQAKRRLEAINEGKEEVNNDLKKLRMPDSERNLKPIKYKPSKSPFGTDYKKSEAALKEQQDREDRLDEEIESIRSKVSSVEGINNSVDLVFTINPKFSSIGTKEEYSRYLEGIFPKSKDTSVWYSTENPNRFVSMPSLREMFIEGGIENPYLPYSINVSKEDKVQDTLMGKQLEIKFEAPSKNEQDNTSTKYQLAQSELEQLKPISDQFSKDISEFNKYRIIKRQVAEKKKEGKPVSKEDEDFLKESKFSKNYIFNLGRPSTILRKIGFPNLPIQMSSDHYGEHILEPPRHSLRNLPFKTLVASLHNPIAIFTNKDGSDKLEIITEISGIQGGNVHVIIELQRTNESLEINSVTTAFENNNYQNKEGAWIKATERIKNLSLKGNPLYVDKERITDYLQGVLLHANPSLKRNEKGILVVPESISDSSTNMEKTIYKLVNFPDILTNVEKRYQQAIAKGNENLLASEEDVSNALQELQKLLGKKYPVEILEDLIKVKDLENTGAYGSFKRGLITLSKKSPDISKTARHEAFHPVMDYLQQVNPKLYNEVFNAASKRYGIERGESKATVKYSLAQQKEIDYVFKAVDIIQKNLSKIKQWESNKSIKPEDFWKKIQQLGVPKEQLSLLKESNGNTVEEKLASFAANYSYTIEINTAKALPDSLYDYETGFEYNGIRYGEDRYTGEYWYVNEFGDDTFIPEKEYKKIQDSARKNIPSQYYSNLTVPGGTNYTENEVSTPLITPSIKGHAQFSTDNGIGWFRSDEVKTKDRVLKEIPIENDLPFHEIVEPEVGSKTRRILEVQSDLFQKWRNNFEFESNKYTAGKDGKNVWHYYKNGNEINANEYTKTWETFLDTYLDNADTFTKLLQKDNNWVTFFLKAVIQDSAKKGYEKVWLPTGNTASKIEGHTTLEEFKKQKEDRIELLEFNKSQNNNNIKGEYLSNEQIDNEINQLKQELERVETEGFAALKPIYNFYENTVINILKKQGYNPVLITDEYGNTWNEVEIKPEYLENIKLQAPNIEYSGDLAIEEKLADEFMEGKSDIAENWFQKLKQWISNMYNLLINEGDLIDKLFRDINQGKFNKIGDDPNLFELGTSEDLENFSKFVENPENRTSSFITSPINMEEVKLNYLLFRSEQEMTDEQAEELLKQCGL